MSSMLVFLFFSGVVRIFSRCFSSLDLSLSFSLSSSLSLLLSVFLQIVFYYSTNRSFVSTVNGTYSPDNGLDMCDFICTGLYWQCSWTCRFLFTSFSFLLNLCHFSLDIICNKFNLYYTLLLTSSFNNTTMVI